MPDAAQYEASQLDWCALLFCATSTAATTALPPAQRWVYFRPERQMVPVERWSRGFLGIPRYVSTLQPRTTLHPVEILGPHWVLDFRTWALEEARVAESAVHRKSTRERHRLALLPNGRLVAGWWYEHRAHHGGTGTPRCLSVKRHHHLSEATEKDARHLDYDKRHRLLRLGTTCGTGDLLRGPRLVHPVKGSGVAAALEAVRNGRAPDSSPRRQSLRSPFTVGVPPGQLVLPHI